MRKMLAPPMTCLSRQSGPIRIEGLRRQLLRASSPQLSHKEPIMEEFESCRFKSRVRSGTLQIVINLAA
jgi:hypothetical protein